MKILFLTTNLRPTLSKVSLKSLRETTNHEIIVCNDKNLEGHVFNYNKSLHKIGFDDDILKCDDDLIYPEDWFEKFKDHFNQATVVCMGRDGSDWGCLMMIPKTVLKKVGYMWEGFGKYGYADCEYRERIRRVAQIIPLELPFLHDKETGIIEDIPKTLAEERELLVKNNLGEYNRRLSKIYSNKSAGYFPKKYK